MIGHFQIFHHTPRNYVAWSHRQPPDVPENPTVFSRPPTFNGHVHPPCPLKYAGRVKWNGNKRRANTFVNPRDSSKTNRFSGKVRRFHFPKRRFTGRRRVSAPLAPHNTTSFLIRAKKSGGITSLVSPCATTPVILTTPTLSPWTEVVVEMAKEKWGVDGYGTMKGLIHVRLGKEDSNETNGSGHLEAEKKLKSDLRRFEMIYPSKYNIEKRVDEHELHISRLEEQNLTLKERVFLIESELDDLRRRVVCLETEGFGLENFNGEDVCSEKSV